MTGRQKMSSAKVLMRNSTPQQKNERSLSIEQTSNIKGAIKSATSGKTKHLKGGIRHNANNNQDHHPEIHHKRTNLTSSN